MALDGVALIENPAFRAMDWGILLRGGTGVAGGGVHHSSFKNSVSNFDAISCAKLSSSTVWTRRLWTNQL